jgi:hypothetical protein
MFTLYETTYQKFLTKYDLEDNQKNRDMILDIFQMGADSGQEAVWKLRQAVALPDGKVVMPGDPDYPKSLNYTITTST